ncbi:Nucleic acid-binding, OB-fold [Sesbania bispinosa]|nr:Nucleic acid-binding, OB-fold [Sesbania bispinosa]
MNHPLEMDLSTKKTRDEYLNQCRPNYLTLHATMAAESASPPRPPPLVSSEGSDGYDMHGAKCLQFSTWFWMNIVSRMKSMFKKKIQTQIFNLKTSTSMRNLNPSGEISIIPEFREAIFGCLVCGFCSSLVAMKRGRITEPTICLKEKCQSRNSMTLVHI